MCARAPLTSSQTPRPAHPRALQCSCGRLLEARQPPAEPCPPPPLFLNQQIWLRLDQPHSTRMHCEIVDNHGEPLLMSNQELYSMMVQINRTLKTQALRNMQVQWRPKSAGKWHPFQWEAILHCPTAEGHRAVPFSVSRNGDCMHVWLRAELTS